MSSNELVGLLSQPSEYMFIEVIGTDATVIRDIQGIAESSSETEISNAGFRRPDGNTIETIDDSLESTEWETYVEDVNLTHNADGSWTARDREWRLTTQAESAMDAIRKLGRVIAAVQGEAGHEPTDEELMSLGVDPDQARDNSNEDIPDFF